MSRAIWPLSRRPYGVVAARRVLWIARSGHLSRSGATRCASGSVSWADGPDSGCHGQHSPGLATSRFHGEGHCKVRAQPRHRGRPHPGRRGCPREARLVWTAGLSGRRQSRPKFHAED
jgi:hypothetical protein